MLWPYNSHISFAINNACARQPRKGVTADPYLRKGLKKKQACELQERLVQNGNKQSEAVSRVNWN